MNLAIIKQKIKDKILEAPEVIIIGDTTELACNKIIEINPGMLTLAECDQLKQYCITLGYTVSFSLGKTDLIILTKINDSY